MRVAVVGLGRMGAAMARRIATESDDDLVVFNRSPEKAAIVAAETGATVAVSGRRAAAHAEVVLVSLADDAAVLETYRGDDGLVAGLERGAVVCDTSTVDPATVRILAPEVAEHGATLLDTPVSGSVPVVERGGLAVMVGGERAALEVARPVLDRISSRIFYLGESGAGATMKLAVNAVVHALNAAVSEALVLAERAGIDRTSTYDVLEASAVAAPFVQYKRAAFLRPEEAPVAFSLSLVEKDQQLIERLASQVGARMDQAVTTHRLVQEAVAAGLGDDDMVALTRLLADHPGAG